jgi:hypothetical protein
MESKSKKMFTSDKRIGFTILANHMNRFQCHDLETYHKYNWGGKMLSYIKLNVNLHSLSYPSPLLAYSKYPCYFKVTILQKHTSHGIYSLLLILVKGNMSLAFSLTETPHLLLCFIIDVVGFYFSPKVIS